MDKHSYADISSAKSNHLLLDLKVDFDKKQLFGSVTHQIKVFGGDTIIFDVRQLNIIKVEVDGQLTDFSLSEDQKWLGSALEIPVCESSKEVKIFYSTQVNSDALLWLNPDQSAGKKHPFLFTQGQAILTRTWIPIQDTPSNKITYEAKIEVPKELMAVMSADGNPTKKAENGIYQFTLKGQPIAPYLIALAVGDLVFQSLGDITGVYAEPAMIEKSAYEFADVEKMVNVASDLYGEYSWGRYDVIVLPPSFPFGGMENPKLTFSTPTIITGDRSLTSLIAHELAHSWSGNLVTNATWDDFWLNEGFTVYFERRIMEELYGFSYAEMLTELGQQDLEGTINEIDQSSHKEDSKLKLDLEGRDPDDGMTDIAYEKGAFFLVSIEKKLGRKRLDAFIRQYFSDFAYKSLTTTEFLEYLNKTLLDDGKIDININGWVYSEGLPEQYEKISANRFRDVEEQLNQFASGTITINQIYVDDWSSHEWLHFLRQIPKESTIDQLKAIDIAFDLSNTSNAEIAFAWFMQNIEHQHIEDIKPQLCDFLFNVGRRKFIKPIYQGLIENGFRDFAKKQFDKSKLNYHNITLLSVKELFNNSLN